MTIREETPADTFLQELSRLYPDEGPNRVTDHARLRPHIATMEAKPQDPRAMDAALTETANLITALASAVRQHFALSRESWDDEEDPDWSLVKAALDRLMDSDSYLRLAESHAVALGAADPHNRADGENTEASEERRQACRLVLLDAAQNALESMKHDASQLVAKTGYAVSQARNTARPQENDWHHGGTRAADALVNAARDTLDPALNSLRKAATTLRRNHESHRNHSPKTAPAAPPTRKLRRSTRSRPRASRRPRASPPPGSRPPSAQS